MNSQSVAGLLGAIVASIVMVVAVADRPVRKARQAAGQSPATGTGAIGSCGASPARAGDSGSAELGEAASPLRNAAGVPICHPTATLTLQSSGAGTTMNSLAAPDVRAPSVRGRWHFRRLLKTVFPY